MKISTLKVFVAGLMLFLLSQGVMQACNLSSMTLVSVTGSGPFVISVNLCIGMGLTGSTKGGDQRTASIFFGFWDTTPGFAVTPGGFSPAQMISPAPAQVTVPPTCRMTGVITGANPTYGTQGNLVYPMPGAAPCGGALGTSYGCINNAVLCGPAISNCSIFVITVNQLPDSMRAFGVEGGGNPIGGCYPNADMKIDFTTFGVEWGTVDGERTSTGIHVKWSTISESNVDYFIVERSSDGVSFESIGEITGTGNSSTEVRYSYFDAAPKTGNNYYRIVQVDREGRSADSETIEVNYFRPDGLSWGAVGPNPASSYVDVSFFNPAAERVGLQLFDVTGKVVLAREMDAINGGNSLRLDLSTINRGSYYLSLQNGEGKIIRKVSKL